ncbi:hypothetical protein KKG19_03965 [Patescibacteria group bacterium]|nr:hypothetical protein [Patescibacteria group bacterium]
MFKKSLRRSKELGWSDQAEFLAGSGSRADLSGVKAVFMFQLPYTMRFIQKNMRRELPKEARLVSNCFEFPDWEPEAREDSVFVYRG